MFTIVNMLLSWFLFFLAVPVSHKKSTVVDSEGMLNFSVCYRGNKECRIENNYFLVASGTFSHKKREVSLIKKSYELFFLFFTTVADSEGSRYFSEEANGPFRSNTWGLQQPLGMFNVCQAMLFRNPVVCAAKRRVE